MGASARAAPYHTGVRERLPTEASSLRVSGRAVVPYTYSLQPRMIAVVPMQLPDLLRGLVTDAFPQGTVHQACDDFEAAIRSDARILQLWETLTPLGRNEFICWVDDAKQPGTRQRRIQRTGEGLLEGKKRPCCWSGCIHRTDKLPGRWQQAVLIDQKGKRRR